LSKKNADDADFRGFVIAGLTRNLFVIKGIPCQARNDEKIRVIRVICVQKDFLDSPFLKNCGKGTISFGYCQMFWRGIRANHDFYKMSEPRFTGLKIIKI
jgi:hypothetical protein